MNDFVRKFVEIWEKGLGMSPGWGYMPDKSRWGVINVNNLQRRWYDFLYVESFHDSGTQFWKNELYLCTMGTEGAD